MTLIPPNLLRLMSKEDRESCGKGNELPEEIAVKVEAQAEKELQREICQYLRLKHIQFINPPMNKRSILPEGWPDFTFAYKGKPIALECKTATGKLSREQAAMHLLLMADGWLVRTVRTLQEVKEILDTIDKEKAK